MTQVTVIVVSYHSQEHLPACLASVEQQRIPTEVIVVDNASPDGSATLVKNQFPKAHIVVNPNNLGFAAAVNQGLALAKGEFVLLLNPDAALLPGALSRLVEFLETHPRAAAAGPRQWLDADRSWQWSIVPSPPHWRLLISGLPYLHHLGLARQKLSVQWTLNRTIWRSDQSQAVPYLSGACLLLRRSALEAIGGLDESYFLFFEDLALCDLLRAAGWTLHAVPTSGVIHAAQGSVYATPDRGQQHLAISGRHYLTRRGDLLTRILWTLFQSRQAQGPLTPQARRDVSATLTLQWPSVQGAAGYWIELAADPLFLYAAATQSTEPTCALPDGLEALLQNRPFFWRVASEDANGQLGPFILSYRE